MFRLDLLPPRYSSADNDNDVRLHKHLHTQILPIFYSDGNVNQLAEELKTKINPPIRTRFLREMLSLILQDNSFNKPLVWKSDNKPLVWKRFIDDVFSLWNISVHIFIYSYIYIHSFKFNGKDYLQTHGTAMGTKMAVAFANIFMAKTQKLK